jgi:hypothetical protein
VPARHRLPDAPTLRASLRRAAEDLYYNSWRFLGANLILGVVLVGVALLSVGALIGLLGLVVAVPPAAGIMRMAVGLQRDGHTDFSDFTAALRRPWRALVVGTLQLVVLLVLLVDMMLGGAMGGTLGAFLTVSALYGVLIWWIYALALWPLLEDPLREGMPVRARLRLAALVLVAFPLRMLAAGLLLGALMLVSAVSVAPLVSIAVAFAWLVAAHHVLPLADRLERRPVPEPDEPADAWPAAGAAGNEPGG